MELTFSWQSRYRQVRGSLGGVKAAVLSGWASRVGCFSQARGGAASPGVAVLRPF